LTIGGPVGLAIAGIGGFFSKSSTKLILIIIGLLIIIVTAVAITVRIEHLEQEEQELIVKRAEITRVSNSYGCTLELEACLQQREKLAAEAKAQAEQKAAESLAAARTDLDTAKATIKDQSDAIETLITSEEQSKDGPVPPVLSDTWKQERARRGVKP
jgi:hypothetical protein